MEYDQTLPQKRYADGQKVCDKIFCIPGKCKSRQQTTTPQYDLRTVRLVYITKHRKTSTGVDAGDLHSPLHAMSTCSSFLENNMDLLKKLRIEPPSEPAIPLLGIYPKDPKALFRKDICTPISLQHYHNSPNLEIAQVLKHR